MIIREILNLTFSWSTHINQNEQQRFNYNVLTHDVMGGMVLAEGDISPCKHQPITQTEAILRISH